MNDQTTRPLLFATIAANVPMLILALVDQAAWGNRYMWPIFVGWAFLVLLTLLIIAASGWRRVEVREVHQMHVAPARLAAPAPAPAPVAPAVPAPQGDFPFRYAGYTLYSRDVSLKNGGHRTIWFFAKAIPKSGHIAAKPPGYHVGVNERTGLPFLKKGTGADGEDLTPNLVQAYRPQCSALTEEGHQCRNSARHESKYCISHFGYQPPSIAKAAANREDTLPAVKGAKDTKPSVRRATQSA
jgi:hypothetical protein